jgi:hypothetical protein
MTALKEGKEGMPTGISLFSMNSVNAAPDGSRSAERRRNDYASWIASGSW